MFQYTVNSFSFISGCLLGERYVRLVYSVKQNYWQHMKRSEFILESEN